MRFRFLGILTGALLGLGAPVGCLVWRAWSAGQADLVWMTDEVSRFQSFYGYMLWMSPFVFVGFGWTLGWLADRMFLQRGIMHRMMVQFERESMSDAVTGLYNHGHIVVEIDREIERAVRYRRTVSGMMIDIDGFKQINDRFGHQTGDSALKHVASTLQSSVRKVDIIGRYGGDEFFVILPETPASTANIVGERVLKNAQSRQFETPDGPMHLTVSIGLCTANVLHILDRSTFIETADQALLKAKRCGKNRMVVAH